MSENWIPKLLQQYKTKQYKISGTTDKKMEEF
jgi:hypothetical protein